MSLDNSQRYYLSRSHSKKQDGDEDLSNMELHAYKSTLSWKALLRAAFWEVEKELREKSRRITRQLMRQHPVDILVALRRGIDVRLMHEVISDPSSHTIEDVQWMYDRSFISPERRDQVISLLKRLNP